MFPDQLGSSLVLQSFSYSQASFRLPLCEGCSFVGSCGLEKRWTCPLCGLCYEGLSLVLRFPSRFDWPNGFETCAALLSHVTLVLPSLLVHLTFPSGSIRPNPWPTWRKNTRHFPQPHTNCCTFLGASSTFPVLPQGQRPR